MPRPFAGRSCRPWNRLRAKTCPWAMSLSGTGGKANTTGDCTRHAALPGSVAPDGRRMPCPPGAAQGRQLPIAKAGRPPEQLYNKPVVRGRAFGCPTPSSICPTVARAWRRDGHGFKNSSRGPAIDLQGRIGHALSSRQGAGQGSAARARQRRHACQLRTGRPYSTPAARRHGERTIGEGPVSCDRARSVAPGAAGVPCGSPCDRMRPEHPPTPRSVAPHCAPHSPRQGAPTTHAWPHTPLRRAL